MDIARGSFAIRRKIDHLDVDALAVPAEYTVAPIWPLFGLKLFTPQLEMRLVRNEDRLQFETLHTTASAAA
jgi:hypothetical protein